jgi:hypothetical protein
MSRAIEVLRVDRQTFLQALPDEPDERTLAARALRVGTRYLRADDPPDGDEIRARMRAFVRSATDLASARFGLVTGRRRLSRADRQERESHERHVTLHREVLPPLMEEARVLRAELRSLEEEARRRGIDVDGIEPQIEWRETFAAEAFQPMRFISNEERRQVAVDFFRRVGGADR